MSDNKADERILAVMRAREDGEREGHIAGLVEAAAMAQAYDAEVKGSDHHPVVTLRDRILAELRRRFGATDPRVLHHLRTRGLAQ